MSTLVELLEQLNTMIQSHLNTLTSEQNSDKHFNDTGTELDLTSSKGKRKNPYKTKTTRKNKCYSFITSTLLLE